MITAGRQVRTEILGDKEYYTGEFKASVNALIEAEPNIALLGQILLLSLIAIRLF